VSAAQFVRDATILRIAYLAAERGDAAARVTLSEVAAAALADRRPSVRSAVEDASRVAAVHATGLIDAPADPALERLARLASRLLDAPIGLVTLIDRDRQVLASCIGLGEPWASRREMPLSHSLCQYAVAERSPLIVSDARSDPAVQDSLAFTELGIVAYAGIPLITPAGHVLGTLCVADRVPRDWTPEQIEVLTDLAQATMSEIRLHGHDRAASAG
jgi:GAF domain-containing protein